MLLYYFIFVIALVSTTASGTSKTISRNHFEINQDSERIVGGVEAQSQEFISIVTVVNQYEFCAGTIYNKDWVLTAGHCALFPPESYKVTANSYNIKQPSGQEILVNVSEVFRHPDYSAQTGENDIALMRLATPLLLNQNINAIPLAPSNFVAQGKATVAGWGLESETGQQPSVLRKVDIPIVGKEECQKFYESKNKLRLKVQILDSVLCAGRVGGSACFGDSGGPLLCSKDGSKYGVLCGLVSSGKKCGDLGIYTRISFYHSWILTTTKTSTPNN